MIVTFEGLDNCGKTTLVEMIHEYYESKGINNEVSKEFGTNIGKEIKNDGKSWNFGSYFKRFFVCCR